MKYNPVTKQYERNEKEQEIKNSIMNWLTTQPNKFFVFTVYNGGVYNPRRKCYQKNPSKMRGVSDIIGIVKWRGQSYFMALEIKTEKGKTKFNNNRAMVNTTEYYENEFLMNVSRMGGIAHVLSSLDECIEAFSEKDNSPCKGEPENPGECSECRKRNEDKDCPYKEIQK